jgi:hypothetical protein
VRGPEAELEKRGKAVVCVVRPIDQRVDALPRRQPSELVLAFPTRDSAALAQFFLFPCDRAAMFAQRRIRRSG